MIRIADRVVVKTASVLRQIHKDGPSSEDSRGKKENQSFRGCNRWAADHGGCHQEPLSEVNCCFRQWAAQVRGCLLGGM